MTLSLRSMKRHLKDLSCSLPLLLPAGARSWKNWRNLGRKILSFLKIHLQREMSKCFLQQEWGDTKLSRLGSNPFGICLSGRAVPAPLLCQNIPSLLPGAVGYPGGNSFNGNGRNGFATPRIPQLCSQQGQLGCCC